MRMKCSTELSLGPFVPGTICPGENSDEMECSTALSLRPFARKENSILVGLNPAGIWLGVR
jgi:hypothetical protein